MAYRRYAIYYTPPPGALADFGAAWLGWDIASGMARTHPDIPGLPAPIDQITATPRKYGLHGTIKPPFALPPGTDPEALARATARLCATLTPVTLPGLALTRLGGFLALTPAGDQAPLADLAAQVVRGLDSFRAPPSQAELARRRKPTLSARQQELLTRWGYPYVMEAFRFHITLTGRLPRAHAEQTLAALTPQLAPLLPAPFTITDLTLAGEDDAGLFHALQRFPLTG